MNRFTFVAALLLLAAPALAAPAKDDPPANSSPANNSPDSGAHAFYDAYLDLRRELNYGGIPDARHLPLFRPLVSARLYKLLEAGGEAELRYTKATKGQSPPLVEGDPFTSLFEGANVYYVNGCMNDAGAGASCTVTLTHREKEVQDVQWRDTLLLVREGGGWKVDDITFGGNWAFGNKGKLSDMLNDAIKESREPVN